MPSSRPAPLDVIGTLPPLHPSLHNGRCIICHSFGYLHVYYVISEHTWDAVVESAQTCVYCDVIVRGCRGWLAEDGKQDWTPKSLLIYMRDDKDQFQYLSPYMDGDATYKYDDNDYEPKHLALSGRRHIVMKFPSAFVPIRIYAPESLSCADYWSRFGTCRRTTGFTGSTAAFEKARTFLRNCVTNHAACGSEKDQRLPTRLLDLGSHDADFVKLVDKAGEYGRYAALSHCWGATPQFTTTIATLSERKNEIALAQLTKTFREAVQVTRAMDIRYLWIDSLCIVQDDHNDWAREASRMSTVYKNALFTISATSSESGNEGLFRRWPEYEARVRLGDAEASTFIFSAERIHFDGQVTRPWPSRDKFPLLNRAWALQERLLSPRVLHFGHSELLFECIEELRCECSGTRDYSWSKNIKEPKMYLFSKTLFQQSAAEIWTLLIRRHCFLQLTYPSDKLVALGGLAKQIAEPGDQYLAGLWKNTFIRDLQWTALKMKPRPKWRAPSWSWASVESSISEWGVFVYGERRTLNEYSPSAQLVNYKMIAKTGDEFGELQSGKVQLSAHCSPVTWRRGAWERNWVDAHIVFPNGQEMRVTIDALDESTSTYGNQAAHPEKICILLFHNSDGRTSLLLRRSESDKDCFERIGLVTETRETATPLEDTWKLFPKEKRLVTIV